MREKESDQPLKITRSAGAGRPRTWLTLLQATARTERSATGSLSCLGLHVRLGRLLRLTGDRLHPRQKTRLHQHDCQVRSSLSLRLDLSDLFISNLPLSIFILSTLPSDQILHDGRCKCQQENQVQIFDRRQRQFVEFH